ncbi:MAG TPA: glycosyltransferase family 39 protein [Anaerolineaceae bacterium]
MDSKPEPSLLDYLKYKLMPWKYPKVEIPDQTEQLPDEQFHFPEESSAAYLVEPAGSQVEEGVPLQNETPLKVEESTSSPGALNPPDQFIQRVEQTEVHSSGALSAASQPGAIGRTLKFPWRSIAAAFLAIIAQYTLEPPDRNLELGVVIYFFAALLLAWAFSRGEWDLLPLGAGKTTNEKMAGTPGNLPILTHPRSLLIGTVLAAAAFLLFSKGLLTPINTTFWFASIAFFAHSFWEDQPKRHQTENRLAQFFSRDRWSIQITRWGLVLLVVFGIAVFYRLYLLEQVPAEMVSDQAEKLWDVYDVLHGKPSTYFPRNTGREMFQMYLTAGVILLFNTGYSFLSLKIGTALAGLATLPFIYLLGKDLGGKRVGLLAMAFTGIAAWPNMIDRIGLRFALYPLFTAPVLLYLIRGLQRRSRNDLIIAGIYLGVGLHGYTPFRIVPFVVVAAIGLYWLHRQSAGWKKQALYGLVIIGVVSFIVINPLVRYTLQHPDIVAYRAMTRVSTTEREMPAPAWQVFIVNLGRAIVMPFWDNGEIWVHSVTHRPALDFIAAALLALGIFLALLRYSRDKHWVDLFLLISIPLLMMPSILSLAFPGENPSLNRTGAAYIPIFLLVGLALDSLMTSWEKAASGQWFARLGWLVAGVFFLVACLQNFSLVFDQYARVYRMSSWNTTEMGQVVRGFIQSVGDRESFYLVGYPYWVDSRLVALNAGIPDRDPAIFTDQLVNTVSNGGTKLFLLNLEDQEDVEQLKFLYPEGSLTRYTSRVETKDFLIFLVPARDSYEIPAVKVPETR